MINQLKKRLSLAILWYFRALARIKIKKVQPQIIGITGSAGKTSTRNAVTAIFKEFRQIKVSHKANSESGIPLNILGLTISTYQPQEWLLLLLKAPFTLLLNREKYDTYIVEMGIDSPYPPKNMEYLLSIVQPHTGVILNAMPVHSEPFDQLVQTTNAEQRIKEISELIAKEKGKLILNLPQKGLAVLNADDKNIMQLAQKTKAKVITFGASAKADMRLAAYQVSLEGTRFTFRFQDQKTTLDFPDQALSKHFASSFAAALATAVGHKIPLKEAAQALEKNFRLPPGRSSLLPAKNGAFILDSSYNASAQPMLDSLELLREIAPGRKFAILGDMRELGEETKVEHEKVAHKAAEICDAIVLVGPAMQLYALPLLRKAGKEVSWFVNPALAAEHFQDKLAKDDVILIKGSQNTLMLEIAVERLMLNPQDADVLLCRRGAYWDKKRWEIITAQQL